jgi:hypothetical protein
MEKRYKCVYVDWFQFNTRCPITTCKFHSSRVDSGCLAINRKSTNSKKFMSDPELLYYKFDPEVDNTQIVALRRRTALTNVKKIILLHHFIEHVRTTGNRELPAPNGALQLAALQKYPLKLKKLHVEPWMLNYLFDAGVYANFVQEHRLDAEFTLKDLLFLSKTDWSKITQERTNLRGNNHG